jgi:hypothetical protein
LSSTFQPSVIAFSFQFASQMTTSPSIISEDDADEDYLDALIMDEMPYSDADDDSSDEDDGDGDADGNSRVIAHSSTTNDASTPVLAQADTNMRIGAIIEQEFRNVRPSSTTKTYAGPQREWRVCILIYYCVISECLIIP